MQELFENPKPEYLDIAILLIQFVFLWGYLMYKMGTSK